MEDYSKYTDEELLKMYEESVPMAQTLHKIAKCNMNKNILLINFSSDINFISNLDKKIIILIEIGLQRDISLSMILAMLNQFMNQMKMMILTIFLL